MEFKTDKPINISQLGVELGRIEARWIGPDQEGVTRCRTEDITPEQWEDAIAAHRPDDNWTDPEYVAPPSREKAITDIVEAAPDWKTAIKTLAAEGILS